MFGGKNKLSGQLYEASVAKYEMPNAIFCVKRAVEKPCIAFDATDTPVLFALRKDHFMSLRVAFVSAGAGEGVDESVFVETNRPSASVALVRQKQQRITFSREHCVSLKMNERSGFFFSIYRRPPAVLESCRPARALVCKQSEP